MILKIENPSLKQQMAAVQKKPELIASLPLAGEKVQLAAVIACPESFFLRKEAFLSLEQFSVIG